MTKRICSQPNCTNPHYGRGLCGKHYQAATARGTLHQHSRTMVQHGATLDERLRHGGWTETNHGCWEWNGSRTTGGYGQMASGRHNGNPKNAIPIQTHRAAYLAWIGPIDDGLVVRHKCDNPPCCNPAHLELGTRADNNKDAQDRWRNANGERAGSAKLTDIQVREVRTRYATGGVTQRELAAEFGVCQQNISLIVRKERRRRPTNPGF